jgi:hypothetical protein
MPVLDTFQAIVGDVHAQAMGVDSLLVEGWVRDTWSEIERQRTWGHLRRQYQIVIPEPYTTGTATFTPGSTEVTIAGGTVSTAFIGRQLQRSIGEPIHEITNVDTGAGIIYISPAWNYTSAVVSAQPYRVFTAFISTPGDFLAFISVRDTERRRRLNLHVGQDVIDRFDRARSHGGRPMALSGIDFARSYAGRVYSALRITGTSPAGLVAGGAYTGQSDALLILKISANGAVDTATFTYQLDGGAATTQTVSSGGNDLPMGVSLLWPTGTYNTDTIYAVRLSANAVIGVPRYELYPHPTEAIVYTAVYSTRPTDPEADGWTVPPPLTGDIIALGAKDLMARYSGTIDKRNPYAQIARTMEFRERFIEAVTQCMTLDEAIIEQNVFQSEDTWPYFTMPWASRTEDVLGIYA